MNDQDGYRIEAALQYGFSWNDDGERYICTQEQLIAFAKSCERKGLAEAVTVATSELKNTYALMSNPPKSAAAWDIRNMLTRKIAALDAELTPIRETEERRFLAAQDCVARMDSARWGHCSEPMAAPVKSPDFWREIRERLGDVWREMRW